MLSWFVQGRIAGVGLGATIARVAKADNSSGDKTIILPFFFTIKFFLRASILMTVLLCFYGQFRSSPRTWQSIKDRLVRPNSADASIIIEKHTAIPPYAEHDFKYIWKIQKITMNSWKAVTNGNVVAKILRASAKVFPPYAFGAPGTKGSGTFIWVSFFHAYQRMRHLHYETYVMTRTDFYYLCPFYVPRRQDCLHTASVERYGGINDRHIVIPRRHLHILGIMKEIARRATSKEGIWCFQCHTEQMLLYVSKSWNISICAFPLTMFLVRDYGSAVRSEKGVGAIRACQNQTFRVKYISEFYLATTQCRTDCGPRGAVGKKKLSVS